MDFLLQVVEDDIAFCQRSHDRIYFQRMDFLHLIGNQKGHYPGACTQVKDAPMLLVARIMGQQHRIQRKAEFLGILDNAPAAAQKVIQPLIR